MFNFEHVLVLKWVIWHVLVVMQMLWTAGMWGLGFIWVRVLILSLRFICILHIFVLVYLLVSLCPCALRILFSLISIILLPYFTIPVSPSPVLFVNYSQRELLPFTAVVFHLIFLCMPSASAATHLTLIGYPGCFVFPHTLISPYCSLLGSPLHHPGCTVFPSFVSVFSL